MFEKMFLVITVHFITAGESVSSNIKKYNKNTFPLWSEPEITLTVHLFLQILLASLAHQKVRNGEKLLLYQGIPHRLGVGGSIVLHCPEY